MLKKLLLYIIKSVHSIFDKEEINNVEFLLNGSWSPEQSRKRDMIVSQGYIQSNHTWGEFDNYSMYTYSKKVKSTKYYDLLMNFFKLK